ncbi:MAG: glycerol-3-phosphate dehydrogenase [Proteobacteria bacterium]|nr:glycerol-3-phosphate dehydrogenase [Pseudomonadota bacterium]
MVEKVFDVAIIGGGINGCGAAADAALRGLSVILIEKDDLASKTTSASSKLIHGGLRYLEYYDFSLVKKALNERQLLLDLAPYLVRPMPFIIPYEPHLRPAWLIRTGLFLYDNLSRKNKLPKSKLIKNKIKNPYFSPLKAQFEKGFIFYDGATDDTRLTIANALQAKQHGAEIRLHTQITSSTVIDGLWQFELNKSETIKAKTLINATGPWVETVNQQFGIDNHYEMTLVKGSHLLVPKIYEGDHAYLLQNKDKRIVFILPFHNYHLIGTTDVKFNGNLNEVKISPEEIDYLLDLVNQYLAHPLQKTDILDTFSGVRPLLSSKLEKTPAALSRDYICRFTKEPAASVCIYGGKITTYRQAAKEAINKLSPIFPELAKSKTAFIPLPGAYLDELSFKDYCELAEKKYHWLPAELRKRYLASYGSLAEIFLKNCHEIKDLGVQFSEDLYQIEVDYLIQNEWATSTEDILWRRTKLGLNFKQEQLIRLDDYLKNTEAVFS